MPRCSFSPAGRGSKRHAGRVPLSPAQLPSVRAKAATAPFRARGRPGHVSWHLARTRQRASQAASLAFFFWAGPARGTRARTTDNVAILQHHPPLTARGSESQRLSARPCTSARLSARTAGVPQDPSSTKARREDRRSHWRPRSARTAPPWRPRTTRRSCRASVRELVFWLVPTVAFMTREQLTTCYHQRLRSHNPC